MHNLRKIAAGEPRGTEGNLARAPPVSYHIEVRTQKAEAYVGNYGVGAISTLSKYVSENVSLCCVKPVC